MISPFWENGQYPAAMSGKDKDTKRDSKWLVGTSTGSIHQYGCGRVSVSVQANVQAFHMSISNLEHSEL